MSEGQCKNVVEVNLDFWYEKDYMRILNSGVQLYVDDSRNNCISARYCAQPEIYHHPSIVRLLKSAPVLQKNTASYALGRACQDGNIETVRELLIGGLTDINNDYYHSRTPVMIAAMNNKPTVLSLLLTCKDLVLDKATKLEGYTALHYACMKGSSPVIALLGSDKRCTPVVLNKKDNNGDTPLMRAVMFGNLESLKEMEKLQGTNFRTENKFREGLLDVAWTRISNKFRKEDHISFLYLLNRRKVESLKEQAARAVACLLSCETDVEKLDIPLILHPWVAGFMPTSPIMNIDRSRLTDNDSSDEEEEEDDDMWIPSDDMDEDEEDDGWTTFSSNDEDDI